MTDAGDTALASRPSMEKRRLSSSSSLSSAARDEAQSAFKRLPDEIIEQILRLTDPDSFASLILLNSNWRRVSQQAHLYAYHLSRCPSYSASHKSIPASLNKDGEDALPTLRRLFARQVKRNLFQAYLRPRTTTIKLVSNSISSSSVPGGEGMQFSSSPRGYHLLAYNSSRIYVLDIRGPELVVKRELKIMRRPVSACTLDDGSLLAVLSSDMQVDVYDLRQHPPKRTQSLVLDNPPRTIALSPCGSVLAAAYEGGIEVSSLHTGALPTDRRAVKCDGVDSLAFSFDGTQLLGTTTVGQPPNTVILTAPYYDPGSHMGENNISALWTTSILFPNTSRDCSHAVLIQESSSEEASWTFTYDSSFETFRAVRIDDLRNGTTYFTGPIPNTSAQSTLLPCTLPAATYCGELVSAGFEGKDVWIYGVPEDLEAVPETTSNSSSEPGVPNLNRRNSSLSVRTPSSRLQETNGGRVPQWQILCDKYRNTFVSGRKVTALEGVSTVKWVADYGSSSLQERLVVAARGVQPAKPITEEDGIDFVDGGRITILDFDYGTTDGETVDITIEVGTQEPEVLEEEHRDMDTEVAIVRRRTVAQRRGGRPGGMRSATSAVAQAESLLRLPALPDDRGCDDDDPLIPRRIGTSGSQANTSTTAHNEPEEATLEEAQEALDAPYAHASPRSGPTLRRAATAAAVNRRLHPSATTNGQIQYRRADGRAEHPHESDADNWVPPPPPYSKEDPGDTPAFLRAPAIPGVGLDTGNQHPAHPLAPAVAAPTQIPPPPPSAPPQLNQVPSHSSGGSSARLDLPKLQTSPPRDRRSRMSWQSGQSQPRAVSASVTRGEPQSLETPISRPGSSSARPQTGGSQFPNLDREDIYDVSPIDSAPPPALTDARQPRRPSGSASSASSHTTTASNAYSGSAAPYQTSHIPDPSNLERPPSSSTQMPQSQSSRANQDPVVGRLPNASTWPKAQPEPSQSSGATVSGYPRSAPAINISNREMLAAALPPLPSPNQLSALHDRQHNLASRPTSSYFHTPRVPIGRNPQDQPPSSNRLGLHANFSSTSAPAPELPLIISTPTGVSGAFDTPDQAGTQDTLAEPVLHAPVPRHPRHILDVDDPNHPVAECLETVYSSTGNGSRSTTVHQGPNGQPLAVPPPPSSSQLTSSSLRHHTSLSRRPSRARRSAARNVQDAKTRGWAGRRKQKKAEKELDAVSSAAWTDVTWASNAPKDGKAGKGSKCTVM
ncbi:F-box domain-containing protein [Apiospora aurea]|uniref:F-box domain-containing protein n=1 Tax=Apiospora aurea TaxID=335848 RepID=A0ABR1QBE1_9PEZI